MLTYYIDLNKYSNTQILKYLRGEGKVLLPGRILVGWGCLTIRVFCLFVFLDFRPTARQNIGWFRLSYNQWSCCCWYSVILHHFHSKANFKSHYCATSYSCYKYLSLVDHYHSRNCWCDSATNISFQLHLRSSWVLQPGWCCQSGCISLSNKQTINKNKQTTKQTIAPALLRNTATRLMLSIRSHFTVIIMIIIFSSSAQSLTDMLLHLKLKLNLKLKLQGRRSDQPATWVHDQLCLLHLSSHHQVFQSSYREEVVNENHDHADIDHHLPAHDHDDWSPSLQPDHDKPTNWTMRGLQSSKVKSKISSIPLFHILQNVIIKCAQEEIQAHTYFCSKSYKPWLLNVHRSLATRVVNPQVTFYHLNL